MRTAFTMHLLLLFFSAFAQDNPELQKMYEEDQRARSVSNINWIILSREDSLREARVYELIKEGKVVTSKDYYHSAMIFQHGRDTLASSMAVKQMRKAIALDSTINRWLLAAAIDRDLMRRNQPQIYGTQFTKGGPNAKWERYKIDTTVVTDVDRKYYGVETLAQQVIKEHNMNLLSISAYYSPSDPIDKTLQLIRTEFRKGKQAAYNITEGAVNSFGYELMNAGKSEDALRLFKLNTELYPTGYNTFDSYGECLMKLGRTQEALAAYKKSLDLNPANANAKKILDKM